MTKFFSIPGTSIHNSSEGTNRPGMAEAMRNHPQFREFYEGRRKRGDDAMVGLPPGTSITVDGEAGVVTHEERSANGEIVTYVRGGRSQTRAVSWGQDKAGEIVVKESKRIYGV